MSSSLQVQYHQGFIAIQSMHCLVASLAIHESFRVADDPAASIPILWAYAVSFVRIDIHCNCDNRQTIHRSTVRPETLDPLNYNQF